MSTCGSVGLFAMVPNAVDVNVRVSWFTWIVDVIAFPDWARNGVL